MKRLVWSASIVLGLLLIGSAVYCSPLLDDLFSNEPFSAETCRDGDVRVRGRMARNLVEARRLQQMTADEVKTVFGSPDSGGEPSSFEFRYRVEIEVRWPFATRHSEVVIYFDNAHRAYEVALRDKQGA